MRGYDLRQSTCLKLIPSCSAGRVIGLGNSGLSAPDYFCPTIIGEKLEAIDARWLWMECSISYIIPSPALFNLLRVSALPLKCGSEDKPKFPKPSRPHKATHHMVSLPYHPSLAQCGPILENPLLATVVFWYSIGG